MKESGLRVVHIDLYMNGNPFIENLDAIDDAVRLLHKIDWS